MKNLFELRYFFEFFTSLKLRRLVTCLGSQNLLNQEDYARKKHNSHKKRYDSLKNLFQRAQIF